MKATISGIDKDGNVSSGGITVSVIVDPKGETMPPITIKNEDGGGRLDIHANQIHTSGNVKLHLFGSEKS